MELTIHLKMIKNKIKIISKLGTHLNSVDIIICKSFHDILEVSKILFLLM